MVSERKIPRRPQHATAHIYIKDVEQQWRRHTQFLRRSDVNTERESRVSRVGGLICSISCSLYTQLVFHATSIIQDGRQVSFGAFEHNSIIHTIIRCWCVQRETYTYTRGTERGTIKTRADFTLYTSSSLSVVSYIFRKNLYECDMFDVDDIISLVPLDKNKRFSICK